jgi:glucose-6-phosphate isomerase
MARRKLRTSTSSPRPEPFDTAHGPAFGSEAQARREFVEGRGGVQLRFDPANALAYVRDEELALLQPRINEIHAALEARQGPSATRGGWLHLCSRFPQRTLQRLQDVAREIREEADIFVVIGIGGSYLGGRAAVEFLSLETRDKGQAAGPQILFTGYHLGSDALAGIERLLKGKSVYVNVISREGTTVETGVAFRFLWRHLSQSCTPTEARQRIIVTSRRGSPLRKLAAERRHRRFDIPDDVGGRYSAFTPVVLLPAAVAGASVGQMIEGGACAEEAARDPSVAENMAYRYAALRKLLYDKGKVIEVFATFDPTLEFAGQWWRQLAGESEGKALQGIFPATVSYTTDLHSMGQWMQQG